MKKLMLSLSLVLGLTVSSLAQQVPVKFGIKAGVNFPNMTVSTTGASASFDSKTSFYAGGTVEFAFSDLFSVQPGLTFVNKGTKLSTGSFEFDDQTLEGEDLSINSSYIEVPVNLLLNLNVGNAGKVFLGGGPYYAFAVSANVKAGDLKEDWPMGSADGEYKRGEFGLNFLGGFQLNNGLNIHAGYGLGLSNVVAGMEDMDVKFKNKAFSVGLGFRF